MTIRLDSIDHALVQIAAGRCVVVVNNDVGKPEGDLVFAAELATSEQMAFTVRYSSGFVCVAMHEADADRLQLPPLSTDGRLGHGQAYAVSVDARGDGTGISATDRAVTSRMLASTATHPSDLTRPGHVVPIRAKPGGLASSRGRAEAAVDLAALAGLRPVSVLAEIVSDREPSAMARGPELREFADRHELALISVESLARYQLEHQPYVHRSAQVRVPLAQGGYTVVGYRSTYDGREHLAFVLGDVAGHPMPLVKIRYEAESGEQPGAPGLRCGTADDDPLGELISAGCGAVVYFRVDGVAATDSGDRGMNSRDQDSRRADLPPRLDARDAAAVDQILADLDLIRAADTAGQSDTATRSLQQATADLARTAVLGMTSADRR